MRQRYERQPTQDELRTKAIADHRVMAALAEDTPYWLATCYEELRALMYEVATQPDADVRLGLYRQAQLRLNVLFDRRGDIALRVNEENRRGRVWPLEDWQEGNA